MVDPVGLFAGVRPLKNAREANYADQTPAMSQFVEKNNMVRNHAPGYFQPPPKMFTELSDVIFRSTLKQVLPVKGEVGTVRFGRSELPKNDYMYPAQGYARGQKPGLASDGNKPMNLPVMPLAGYYDPSMLNVLGGVKG